MTPVPEDALHRIMEAARLAPSGGNGQGWSFVIVQDPDTRGRLAAAAGDQSWIAEAPVVIACCAKPELPVGEGDDFGRQVNILRWGLPAVEMMEEMREKELLALLMGNCGTMIPGAHIALAASAEGLGTCWIGYLDIQAASSLLYLPEDWRCYFLITLGYPAKPTEAGGHDRLRLVDTVFMDRWGASWPKADEPSPLTSDTSAFSGDALSKIAAADKKPEPYAPSEDLFWDHPHISKCMLDAHLNPDLEAASRTHIEIDATVEWLAGMLRLGPGTSMLDCGCGPGLYCTRFARKGVSVTGIDYSRNSIAYAEERAQDDGLPIRYIRQNYLAMDFDGEFDAAFIIYFDYGVLSAQDRSRFLSNVYRALKPGGRFALDVESSKVGMPLDGSSFWSASPNGGFWRPGPYIELKRDYAYPEIGMRLAQIMIAEPDGPMSVYRLWNKAYTQDEIRQELEEAGFVVEGAWESLSGRELREDSSSIAVVCRKPLLGIN